MIARIWTAQAARATAQQYAQHLREAVLPQVQTLPGYRGATLLEREDGDHVEIVVVTWWQALEDIRAFAGATIDRAVVTEEARALLTRFDREVRHFHVALDDDPAC